MKKGVYYKLFIGTAAFLICDACLSFIILLNHLNISLNILIALGSSFIFSYIVALILESILNKSYAPDDNYNIQFAVGLIILTFLFMFLLYQIL